MEDLTKYKVVAELQKGRPAKDIAEDLDVAYGKVLKIRREYEVALANNEVDSFIKADSLLVAAVSEELSTVVDVSDAAEALSKGVEGLDKLNTELHKTALLINTKVQNLAISVQHLSELEIAADIITKLQVAFFNKNSTQVNIQNNLGDTPRYSQFLGDAPGA